MSDRPKRPVPPSPPSGGRPPAWRYLIWILALWLAGSLLHHIWSRDSSPVQNLSYSEFRAEVRDGNVAEITVKGQEITGSYREAVLAPPPGEEGSGEGADDSAGTSDGEEGAGSGSDAVGSEGSGEGSDAEGLSGSDPGANADAGRSTSDAEGSTDADDLVRYEDFRTTRPPFEDTSLMGLLEEHGVTVYAEAEEDSHLWSVVISILPWLLIGGFFIWSTRKFQQRMGGGRGGGGIFGFGKSKAKEFTAESVDVSYDDVAGLDNAKKELEEVVEFLKEPSRFQKLGGHLPTGMLLVGKPGVGKTLLARATAGEAGVPFFSISGSEFIEMFVGVGASRVRDMFEKAKKQAPSIIFIDEIDSIGRVRGSGLGGGHDEREQTLNQILAEMDGFSPRESVVVMAATNRPDVLDPALVRPGRFDRQIALDLPRQEARRKILEIHVREVPLSDDVDLERISRMTVGFSGADLRNLVNEAALLAARDRDEEVGPDHLVRARDKILMGIEREEVIQDDEREVIAYHESGHALMALLLADADPLEKITIIPRGQALGATEQIPEKERYNLSRQYLLNRIAVMLGGRAAEKLQFGDFTTGAADDLQQATRLAQRMVCQWGMSERIGPTTFRRGEKHPFLGKEMSEGRDFSEHTAQLIDEEVQRIVSEMEVLALDTLGEHHEQLDTLAEALVEHESLSREQVDELLDGIDHVYEVEVGEEPNE